MLITDFNYSEGVVLIINNLIEDNQVFTSSPNTTYNYSRAFMNSKTANRFVLNYTKHAYAEAYKSSMNIEEATNYCIHLAMGLINNLIESL